MKKRVLLLVKILVSGALVCWLYRGVDIGDIRSIFASVDLAPLLLLYVLFFTNTVLSSVKWRILLHADGIHVPLPSLVMSYLVGTFFNLFLPSNIGGDAYRIYDIARYSDRPANAFASVFADRLSGFVALVGLGALAAVLAWSRLPGQRILLLALGAFAAIMVMLWALTQERLLRKVMELTRLAHITKLQSFFDKFMSSIRAYREHPGLLVKVLGISLCFQVTAIFCIWLIAHALRIEAPLHLFFVFVPLISLLEALPISVYGLGVRDASYVFFFGYAGVAREQALSMALLYVGLTLLYALAGGVIFVTRRPHRERAA